MQGVFILYVFMEEVLNTYRIYNKYTLQYTLVICIPISPREYNAGCIYFVCILYVFMEGVLNTYKIYPRYKIYPYVFGIHIFKGIYKEYIIIHNKNTQEYM